jgi:hypothetical protein
MFTAVQVALEEKLPSALPSWAAAPMGVQVKKVCASRLSIHPSHIVTIHFDGSF